MQLSTLRTAVFDLDGTLTDSRDGILRCLETALRQHGVSWEGSLAWFIGPPAGPSFARLMPTHDEATRQRVLLHYRDCYASSGWAENAVYPGILELLTALQERGVSLYVCTSKRAEFAARILDHFALTPFFAGIVGDSGTSTHHDKADLLRDLIRDHHIDPSSAVMIGDREFDILAARAAGLVSIAVHYGFGSEQELRAAQPEFHCATVENLTELLLRHSAVR